MAGLKGKAKCTLCTQEKREKCKFVKKRWISLESNPNRIGPPDTRPVASQPGCIVWAMFKAHPCEAEEISDDGEDGQGVA